MSIILDKVYHEYSRGTAYQVQALKNINLKSKMVNSLVLSGIPVPGNPP